MEFEDVFDKLDKDEWSDVIASKYAVIPSVSSKDKADAEQLIMEYEQLIIRFIGEKGAKMIEDMRETAIGICMMVDRPADEILPIVKLDVMLYVTQDIARA